MLKRQSLISIILLSLFLAGCAGTQSRNTDPENDPWEGYNRKVFAFNQGLDKIVRPVAVGYDKIMPDPLQRGVGNFFRNLDAPVTFLNQILQGKFKQSGDTLGRFLLNSTFGLLGFFDVATGEDDNLGPDRQSHLAGCMLGRLGQRDRGLGASSQFVEPLDERRDTGGIENGCCGHGVPPFYPPARRVSAHNRPRPS